MENNKHFIEACKAMQREGTLTNERMLVALLMFLPPEQAERALELSKKKIRK